MPCAAPELVPLPPQLRWLATWLERDDARCILQQLDDVSCATPEAINFTLVSNYGFQVGARPGTRGRGTGEGQKKGQRGGLGVGVGQG